MKFGGVGVGIQFKKIRSLFSKKKKKSSYWLVITSKRKLTAQTFHPTTNYESRQVMICLVGLAAVFLYSISRKGREQEHRNNKG